MKNAFLALTSLIFLASFSASAATDLSGLRAKNTKPSLEKVQAAFLKFKSQIKNIKLSDAQKNSLDELEQSTKSIFEPPTLKRQSSRGPAWRAKALDYIDSNYDIHENVSYTDEDGDASAECNFNEDGVSEIGEHFFTWNAVKPVRGSQQSIAYIVSLVVSVKGHDKNSGKEKSCEHIRSEYAFEAALNRSGQPIEIKDWQ